MPWTLQHASTTQPLATWGLSNCVLTLRSFEPSTLAFDLAGNFDASSPFAYADLVTLRDPGDVVRFIGRVRQLPQEAQGTQEARKYVVEDVLGDLARRPMQQQWQTWDGEELAETTSDALVLFMSGSGVARTIAQTLGDIVAYAASTGIGVQMGSAANMGVSPRPLDAKGITILEALREVSRFTPDLMTRVDYSTTPPTLHFSRRVDAAARTVAVLDDADAFSATPLHDQQVGSVVCRYEISSVILGQAVVEQVTDAAPEEADGTEENALVVHAQLTGPQGLLAQGITTQSQELETVAIDEDSFTWWERLWPELAERNEAATLTETSLSDEISSPRMILNGAQPAWTGAAATVTVQALFNGIIGGQVYLNKKLIARVNASTLASNTFTLVNTPAPTTADPGETVPVGLAALLYSALSPLQWRGRHASTLAEPTFDVMPGDKVSFSGTDTAALGTAAASVQSVEINIDRGTREIVFGPAPFLPFSDIIDLLKSFRNQPDGSRIRDRIGSPGANTSVQGAGMGPAASLVPTETAEVHPFKVTRIGTTGNVFRVEGGLVDGVAVEAQTVDIGSTRPLYVQIWPKYDVSIDNSEFVWAVNILSGYDEEEPPNNLGPVFASSTTVSDDVTLITAAGDEARCVIAVVGEGNIITQHAHGHIVTTASDDGSLTGKALLSFDRNA